MARVSFRLQDGAGGSGLRTDNTRVVTDGAMTETSTTFTSATANFALIDEGANIIVEEAGTDAASLTTTIVSFTNSTTVELADPASLTVSGVVATIFTDDSDGLRADGVQLAPGEVVYASDSFLEATSSCYGEVDLKWGLPLQSISINPVPTEAVVVYSPFGHPETISSGSVVAESSVSRKVRHPGLKEGEFAYYTLFVRYQSLSGDDYFEPVAQISEIVPRNFGSTISMWERIPSYYRERDTEAGTVPSPQLVKCLGFDNYGDKVGPLLEFLSIFGFEMDRVRSLAAHVARSKDPQHADAVSLNMLAYEMGTIINLESLGAYRLRSHLDSIGTYRTYKGTSLGTQFAVKSVSGNDSSVNEVTRELNVNSGRVNYVTDPKNVKTPVDIETTRAADDTEADNPSTWDIGDVPPSPSASAVVYNLNSPVSVVAGDIVSFSVHSRVGVLGNIAWARLSDSSTDAVLDTQVFPSLRYGVLYFDIRVTTAATVNVEFMVLNDSIFDNSKYLLEKNSQGEYFDGSLVRGGWLTGSPNISDFRWEGDENNSRSLYSEDYERTRQVVADIYNSVLPVTVAGLYSVNYNIVP